MVKWYFTGWKTSTLQVMALCANMVQYRTKWRGTMMVMLPINKVRKSIFKQKSGAAA